MNFIQVVTDTYCLRVIRGPTRDEGGTEKGEGGIERVKEG